MKTLHLLLPAALLLLSAYADASVVIYRQNFGNSGSSKLQINAASVDWRGNRAEKNGTAQTIGGSDSTTYPLRKYDSSGVWYTQGAPTGLPNVNSTTSQSDTNGFIYIGASSSIPAYSGLLYQNLFAIDRSQWAVESFSWYAAATYEDNVQRLAVRVGPGGNNEWYVSAPLDNAPGGLSGLDANNNFQTTAGTFSVNLSSATWYTFDISNYTIGGSAVALPESDITAFGIYAIFSEELYLDDTSIARNFAFDTFSVHAEAIPEPGSVALLVMGAGGLLCVRLRRRRNS